MIPKSPLHRYRYTAKRSTTRVRGSLLACSSEHANEQLRAQGLEVLRLTQLSLSLFAQLKHRVTQSDITMLTQQLSTLLNSGVALLPALALITQTQHKAGMRALLYQLITHLESGHSLANALRHASPQFDDFYCQLIANGELSGRLAPTLSRLTEYREKSQRLKSKVIKAMIYPLLIVFVALVVSYLMLTMVIPEFERMFSSFGAPLPWFTQQVLTLSTYIQTLNVVHLILATLPFTVLHWAVKRHQQWQLSLSRLSLRLPIIGELLSKAALARFSRSLALSCQAGVSILTGLENAIATTQHAYYQIQLQHALQDTAAGSGLTNALRQAQCFPELMLQMLHIGEQSGQMDTMLLKVSDLYEFEVENLTDNLGKAIEPMIILVLGSLIGALVIAMYLPIFNLMSVLG